MKAYYQKQLLISLWLEAGFYIWAISRNLEPFLSVPIMLFGFASYTTDTFLWLIMLNSLCFLDIGFYGVIFIKLSDTEMHIRIFSMLIIAFIILVKSIKIYAITKIIENLEN